jgi:hypothetical protein
MQGLNRLYVRLNMHPSLFKVIQGVQNPYNTRRYYCKGGAASVRGIQKPTIC